MASPLWLYDLSRKVRGLFGNLPSGMPQIKPGAAFHDRRATAGQVHAGQKAKGRSWKTTTGICLHQTACHMGERPARYDNTGAHVIVTRMGQVIWLHNFDKIIAAANGWNTQTVSIEVDGLYAGVEGRISTVWDDPSTPFREQPQELTDAAVDATCDVIRWIYSEATASGAVMRALVAHRQASESRRNDPGSAIWQRVALPMAKELGLSDGGIGFKLPGGYAIPEEWDPRNVGIRY